MLFSIHLRAIDVFNYSFPFGIGHGMYTLYINESFVPQVAESIVFEKSKAAYYGISASKNASYHNAFFQFIGDFNFLGLVTLITYILVLIKNILMGLKNKYSKSGNIYFAYVCSLIGSTGIMISFDSSSMLYFLYGMLLFLSFVNPNKLGIK